MKRTLYNSVRVKVLQLQPWMRMQDYSSFPKLETENPRFNRDGYYLDYDICWFEYNGVAYMYNAEDFLYTLSLLNYNILGKKEKDAITWLGVMGLASKEQLIMVQKSKQLEDLRRIKRHFLLMRKKMKL